ncbi:CBS domain-containing protein [Paraliomyxa miuraensis]|uniref:CBS domain-containing protein n=1 Tax=Paraliomyxa miuraensis TaxID=376150 RepID=UPI002255AB97|nr:CBS domain-containing protein [Paraliomyxa miuraensis]MCX4245106.1 CBS domain-containing protein [Paraliomyxa miuraensis]
MPCKNCVGPEHRATQAQGMQAQDLMTEALITIKPSDTVRVALRLMEDQDVRHLPVVEGTRLVGMVSDRDLREYRLPVIEEIENPEYADDLLETPVSELMNTDLVTLEPGEGIKTVIDVMLEYKVGALPVIDQHGDELRGIVSYVDVLRALRDTLD